MSEELLKDYERWHLMFNGWLELHPLTAAAISVLLIVALAFLIDRLIGGMLGEAAKRSYTHFDDRIVEYLHRPIFYSVLIFGLLLIVRVFDLDSLVALKVDAMLLTCGLFLWSGLLTRVSRMILQSMSARSRDGALVRPQTLPLFENFTIVVIVVFVLYLLFVIWEIDMTAWLASAGIVGIAIGFAAKDTLANLFSGVFILADGTYKIGDFIVLDTGERGEISHIGLRTTRMFTTDFAEISVPNAVIGNAVVINESGGRNRASRIRVAVGVAYGTDIARVQDILASIAATNELVHSEPGPVIRFRKFGGSSLDFELLCWVEQPANRGRLIHELNISIYNAFNEQGIEIPYAKQDVYIKETPLPTGFLSED
jgi:MscS family membrane protein